jgi:hypothetical protein
VQRGAYLRTSRLAFASFMSVLGIGNTMAEKKTNHVSRSHTSEAAPAAFMISRALVCSAWRLPRREVVA